jgi:AraC-like DNA-binding protein
LKLGRLSRSSRSLLAERFTNLVGIPPMQYLAKWRMRIASELLTGGNANVATVAVEIGYASEAAFSCFQEDGGGVTLGLASPP